MIYYPDLDNLNSQSQFLSFIRLLFGLAVLASVASCALAARGQGSSAQSRQDSSGNNGYEDLALWIDKEQVKMFSGEYTLIEFIFCDLDSGLTVNSI